MSQVHLVLYFIQFLETGESEVRPTSVFARVAPEETDFRHACVIRMLEETFVFRCAVTVFPLRYGFLSRQSLTLIARYQ